MLFLALIASITQSVIALGISLLLMVHPLAIRVMHLGIPFATGTILGNVFFHLLPEVLHDGHYGMDTAWAILLGILIMLLVEAYFHCSHDSVCQIDHHKDEPHHVHFGSMSLVGDALHNFLDGIAIGVAFLVSVEVGIATTVAVALHEIPQEFADVAMMQRSRWHVSRIIWANVGVSFCALLGVVTTFLLAGSSYALVQYLLPVAIGQFIYIALADLLPEIHRKSSVKKYIAEILLICLGVILMFFLVQFLPHTD